MAIEPHFLTINSGSSSLKFGLYATIDGKQRPSFSGTADGINKASGKLTLKDGDGKELLSLEQKLVSQSESFALALDRLHQHSGITPSAIGHRIVHGGPDLRQHQRITPELLKKLEAAIHFAPLHIPASIDLIHAAQKRFPDVPQFACFDTAFHITLPPEAFTYPIPIDYRNAGIQRYGFHGLSYESIVEALRPDLPHRLVVAHLGNGCSLCAIADGTSIDTSMGLTPTGGIPMSTRIGDIDPGVPLLIMRGIPSHSAPVNLDALEDLLNHQCGLQALTGGLSDMREISKAADSGNKDATLAITIFSREIAKTIASYASILGGIDTLIFTGGIGEHSASIRTNVCNRLGFLGLHLDDKRNQAHDPKTLSTETSSINIRMIPADEDGQIARHIATLT